MSTSSATHRIYSFGEFELDVDRGALLNAGRDIKLRPKSFEVLRYLVERQGQLVSRDELLDAIWGNTVVTDDAVTQCLIDVRRAIGDESQKMIQTIPRRGYIFDLPVTKQGGLATTSEARTGSTFTSRWPRRQLAGALVLVLGVAIVWWGFVNRSLSVPVTVEIESTATPNSIAVLPFVDMSPNQDQGYFSDGISEELLNLLAQVPDLRVISRTSAFSFRDQGLDIPDIAQRLNVAHVLEGSVRMSGNKIRITAQLIKADDGFHLWSKSYERELDDIFVVQDEIAAAIRDVLNAKLALTNAADEAGQPSILINDNNIVGETDRRGGNSPVRIPTNSSTAHIAYLKGRYYLSKRSEDGLKNAKQEFESAIQVDPEYALAYSGLADTYGLLMGYGYSLPAESRPKQRAAAYKALELDETSAEAHVSVATVLALHEWDWHGAERVLRRAIEIYPNYATALQRYGNLLAIIGNPEHVTVMERAQLADPVSMRVNVDLGLAYYYNGDYENAISQLRNTLELDPDFQTANGALGLALIEVGHYDEGIAEIEKGAAGELSRWLGYAHAKAGNVDEALAIAEQWQLRWDQNQSGAVALALIYTGLGQMDRAFDWLDTGIDQKNPQVVTLQTYAYWKPLRSDPRYSELLRRVNLLN